MNIDLSMHVIASMHHNWQAFETYYVCTAQS